MSKTLSAVLLTMLALIAMAAGASAADGENENPLQPLDASSPRAAFLSFVEQTGVIADAALEYRVNRSLEAQGDYLTEVAKTRELSDLSEVPLASQDTIVESNFAALADILMRIPLPIPRPSLTRTRSTPMSSASGHYLAPRSRSDRSKRATAPGAGSSRHAR